MKIKVSKSSNRVDAMFASMMKAHGKELSVGHFSDQGTHYSGYSYPDLLAFWDRGISGDGKINGPKRVLLATAITLNNLRIAPITRLKERWFATQDSSKFLNDLGKLIQEIEVSIFGEVGPLMSPDRNNTPLYETGDLASKTTYRIK